MRNRLATLSTSMVMMIAACQTPPEEDLMEQTDVVILVHGLARTHRSFARLESALSEEGYRVVGWDYPSLNGRIADHGAKLRMLLLEHERNPLVGQVHLVTHSMGGLVTRSALGTHPPAKVNRIVMLAPPNQGSPLARILEPVLGWAGPLYELSDHPDSTANQLPIPPGVEIGVIAASWDHAVDDAATHLEGETDHIEMQGIHSMLMWQQGVIEQVQAFLKDGRFRRE